MPGMQFPYPRRTSDPVSAYTPRNTPLGRRRSLKALAPYILGGIGIIWFLIWLFGASGATGLPAGSPEVVIVTTFDPKMSESYKTDLKENRRFYAKRHGYATFFPNTTDYDLMPNVPRSWSTIPAMRHAMTLFPHTKWLLYITHTALIMNQRDALMDSVLEPRKLEQLMLVDQPILPPNSVIKTFSHLKGDRVEFVLTQDGEGLSVETFAVRNGEWAKFFLDSWYDPLYRSYNFQKAEAHALEHLVQWHGTVLAKLALVPQRILNSYSKDVVAPAAKPDGLWASCCNRATLSPEGMEVLGDLPENTSSPLNSMADTNRSIYGLILSYFSKRRPSLVDGQEMIDQPVSQYPCSEQRWRDAYANRKANPDCTVHGRVQELQGLRQFLVSRGAIVETYQVGANDGRVQPHGGDKDFAHMLGSVADSSTPERTILDDYKHALLDVIAIDHPNVRHIVLTDPGILNASLLLLIVPETVFERAYQMLITGKLAAITTNDARYTVVGLYEKGAEDQPGDIGFCCTNDQALHLFNGNGEHPVLKVIDTRGGPENYHGPIERDKGEKSRNEEREVQCQDARNMIVGQQTKS
nr:putative alpha-1,2-galactosyltransferase c8d2.17 [Quercus suber]